MSDIKIVKSKTFRVLEEIGKEDDAPFVWVNPKIFNMAKEIERLNNIINKAIKWFDNADRQGLNELLDILKGDNKE